MSKSQQKQAASSHGYEFCGPPGVFAITVTLPLICYLAAFLCNDVSGCPAPSLLHPSKISLAKLKEETGWPGISGLANYKATGWLLAYYSLSLILQSFLPGEETEGTVLRSGARLQYKFNAFSSAVTITLLALVTTSLQWPGYDMWDFIWDNYVQLITANLGIAVFLACVVYIRSFSVKPGNHHRRELAAGGHTGNLLYDWFIGRELNPRVDIPLLGTIDIKTFMEVRPGMLGWVFLDLAFVAHQYKLYGFVSDSILLITAFQAFYVFDALYVEPLILGQIDITTDGFGFMLAFGDLVWLPFTYSLQARYLAIYPLQLGIWGVLGVFTVQGFGYYIFRSANNEKGRFRSNPQDSRVAHLTFIETKSGSKLLTSGWWGRARHINYLGDWIMGWSYCLPTGIAGYVIEQRMIAPMKSAPMFPDDRGFIGGDPIKMRVVQEEAKGWGMIVTYFYLVYFAILLIHREMRDEEKCKRKYGKDWDRYTKQVRWRILPGIY